MKFGILAIAIGIIFFVGFYSHAVKLDFEKDCSKCVTYDCMESDVLCGDFGIYWVKMMIFVALFILSTGSIFYLTLEKNERRKI